MLIPLFVCSFLGLIIEIFHRAMTGALVGFNGLKYVSFAGWTSIWMLPVYFIGFGLILILNDLERYYKLPIWFQTLFGGFLIGLVELLSGILLNIIFKLNVWYYPNLSILHQVTLSNYILFTLAVPFAIWFIDLVDGLINDRDELIYHVLDNYRDLIRGK